MLFHDHLPLTQITNHNSSLNQLVSNEMRRFVQAITLLVAFLLGNALVNLAQVNIPARFLLALVPLCPDFVELFVVPLTAFEPANGVEPILFIDASCQRLNAKIKGDNFPWRLYLFLDPITKRSVVVTSAIPTDCHFSKALWRNFCQFCFD